jgi:hypothetical protein
VEEENLPSLGGVASAGGDRGNDASAAGDDRVGSRAGGLAAGVRSRASGVSTGRTSRGGRLSSRNRGGTSGVGDCNGDGC